MPCKSPEGMISQWACQAAGVVTLRTLDRTPFASRWRADLSACCVLRFLSSTPVLSRWNRITGQRWSQVWTRANQWKSFVTKESRFKTNVPGVMSMVTLFLSLSLSLSLSLYLSQWLPFGSKCGCAINISSPWAPKGLCNQALFRYSWHGVSVPYFHMLLPFICVRCSRGGEGFSMAQEGAISLSCWAGCDCCSLSCRGQWGESPIGQDGSGPFQQFGGVEISCCFEVEDLADSSLRCQQWDRKCGDRVDPTRWTGPSRRRWFDGSPWPPGSRGPRRGRHGGGGLGVGGCGGTSRSARCPGPWGRRGEDRAPGGRGATRATREDRRLQWGAAGGVCQSGAATEPGRETCCGDGYASWMSLG